MKTVKSSSQENTRKISKQFLSFGVMLIRSPCHYYDLKKKNQLCFYLSKNADTRHNWVIVLYDIYTVLWFADSGHVQQCVREMNIVLYSSFKNSIPKLGNVDIKLLWQVQSRLFALKIILQQKKPPTFLSWRWYAPGQTGCPLQRQKRSEKSLGKRPKVAAEVSLLVDI